MSAWLAIPSKRPAVEAEKVLDRWRAQGYLLAIWRDRGDEPVKCDIELRGDYTGYASAVNTLTRWVFQTDKEAEWVVCAGDDTLPDPLFTAEQIASQCTAHFKGSFGVMQPTGDGHGIETIAGSPWLGREWCRRANGGNGPLWPEYTHNFVDNELMEVAKRLGVFWQRPDLNHKHNNWMFTGEPKPAFLEEAYSQAHWQKYRSLFMQRQAAGFPGHEPVPLAVMNA